jgi:hypothetical protein
VFPEHSFTCLSDSIREVFLIEKSHLSLKFSEKGASPPCSTKRTIWKKTPVSRAFLYVSFRLPSKGALLLGSPQKAPTERDAPFPEPSFICFSKSLVNKSPSIFPKRVPMKKDFRFQSVPFLSFRVPSKAPQPLPGSSNRAA